MTDEENREVWRFISLNEQGVRCVLIDTSTNEMWSDEHGWNTDYATELTPHKCTQLEHEYRGSSLVPPNIERWSNDRELRCRSLESPYELFEFWLYT
jgi:hypothetical protein